MCTEEREDHPMIYFIPRTRESVTVAIHRGTIQSPLQSFSLKLVTITVEGPTSHFPNLGCSNHCSFKKRVKA